MEDVNYYILAIVIIWKANYETDPSRKSTKCL